MHRYRLCFILLLSILIISCSKQDKVKVESMDLVQGVYASGNIRPEGFYKVTTKVSGILDEILVEVGQEVEAGTPLLKMRNRPGEMNLQVAKNQYELAQRNASDDSDLLRELSQQVESARSAYRQDSLEFIRYRALREDRIGSVTDLDRIRLRFQTSKNTYEIARSRLSEAQTRLRVELENARNHYIAQQSLTGDYTLLSVIDGMVYDIRPENGELLSPKQVVMEIGSKKVFEAELQVDETDITLIRTGQQVYYDLDAIEDTVLSGSITLIYPRVDAIERTARVVASLDPAGYTLYPGMTLEANVVVQEKQDILVLPVEYLNDKEQVILENGDLRSVKTGIRDLNYVEILSGLNKGDIVIKPES